MPTYCYMKPNGEVVDRFFHMGQAPRTILDNGVEATRSFSAERKSYPSTTGWPMECMASGVGAKDRESLEREFTKLGVPTKVSADGNPIYTDHNHRKKALKARGFVDRNAYS
jgi:hypothetical protein